MTRIFVSRDSGALSMGAEKVAMAIATEALVQAFGANFRTRAVSFLRTHWASDPWSLGGYSHAKPGRADSRLLFSEPVADRIVLAGEHCSIPFFSTVHGAHLSGIAAAARALALQSPSPG